jgi:hypothetical protein
MAQRIDKHVWLRKETDDLVRQYAAIHQMKYGRALEYLALAGLQDTKPLAHAQTTALHVQKTVRNELKRFAKLLIHTAVEASAARHTANLLLFLELLEIGEDTAPEDLEALLTAPEDETGDAIVALYNQRLKRSHRRAVVGVQKYLPDIEEMLAELNAVEDIESSAV